MHVLFITAGYPYRDNILPGIFIRTLVLALTKLGVEIEVVAPVPWTPRVFSRFSKKWKVYYDTPVNYFDEGGIVIHRPKYLQIPIIGKKLNLHNQFAYLTSQCIIRKPDIIHAHYSYAAGLTAAILSKKWEVPSLLTLHGSDVNVYPYLGNIERARFIKGVRGQSRVTAVSIALADVTEQLAGIRPVVMPLGKDLTLYQGLHDKETARKILGFPQKKFIVLFVGRLVIEKGVRELLLALELLKSENIEGYFCGSGPLENEIEKNENAHWCGLVEPKGISLFMAAADTLVLPTYREGMPTVLIEGGASRIPIIASRVGGIPELIGEDRGILISPKSIDEIVQAIRDVKCNPTKAKDKAIRLEKHIQSNYDSRICAQNFLNLYTNLVENDNDL